MGMMNSLIDITWDNVIHDFATEQERMQKMWKGTEVWRNRIPSEDSIRQNERYVNAHCDETVKKLSYANSCSVVDIASRILNHAQYYSYMIKVMNRSIEDSYVIFEIFARRCPGADKESTYALNRRFLEKWFNL